MDDVDHVAGSNLFHVLKLNLELFQASPNHNWASGGEIYHSHEFNMIYVSPISHHILLCFTQTLLTSYSFSTQLASLQEESSWSFNSTTGWKYSRQREHPPNFNILVISQYRLKKCPLIPNIVLVILQCRLKKYPLNPSPVVIWQNTGDLIANTTGRKYIPCTQNLVLASKCAHNLCKNEGLSIKFSSSSLNLTFSSHTRFELSAMMLRRPMNCRHLMKRKLQISDRSVPGVKERD